MESENPQWIVSDNPLEVMPIGDLREHNTGSECWCHPIESEGILLHNSMDQREFYERGERKPN